MAGQDAVVVQNLFHVELVEPLHVCREILDLVVGGRGGCGRAGGIGLCGVHRHAAQSNQYLAVHGYCGAGVVAGVFANGDDVDEERCVYVVHATECGGRVLTATADRPALYSEALGTCRGPAAAVYTAVTGSGRQMDESGAVCFLP